MRPARRCASFGVCTLAPLHAHIGAQRSTGMALIDVIVDEALTIAVHHGTMAS
jgi:hypothetical protein